MKKMLLVCSIITFLMCCSNDNSWEKLNLKGRVASYTEREYDVENKFGEWVRHYEYPSSNKYIFNKNGKLIQIDSYSSNRELNRRQVIKEEESYLYDSDGDLEMKTINKKKSKSKGAWENFDKDGLLLQKGSYTAKRSGHIETEQYVSLLPDGKKEEASRIIKYDKTGNVISERYESEDFSFYRRYEYLKFDNKNNWTERLVYLSDTAEIPNNIQIREIEYF